MTVQSGVACGATAIGLALATSAGQGAGRVADLAVKEPVLEVVRPAPGVTLAEVRPVVVLRFRQADDDDPLDFASFRISVDGIDQSSRFHVTVREAWGTIEVNEQQLPSALPGRHLLSARVCSVRGVCANVESVIRVMQWTATNTKLSAPTRRERLLELLLAALRKLLR